MTLPKNVIINIPIVASLVADAPFDKDNAYFEIGESEWMHIYFYSNLEYLGKSVIWSLNYPLIMLSFVHWKTRLKFKNWQTWIQFLGTECSILFWSKVRN